MYKEKGLNNFKEVKERYTALRELERIGIINYLKGKGLQVERNGGRGRLDYTNNGKLERSYDLRNWKTITFCIDEQEILISLQAFDRDKSSTNYHVLMDRIGICVNPIAKAKPDYYATMKVTALELPLNEKDLEELYNLTIQYVQAENL